MEPELPTFYVVSRKLPIEQAPNIAATLAFTPVSCAIVSDIHDYPLAYELAKKVVRTDTEIQAEVLAQEMGYYQPVVVIGNAVRLDACYADGRREAC